MKHHHNPVQLVKTAIRLNIVIKNEKEMVKKDRFLAGT